MFLKEKHLIITFNSIAKAKGYVGQHCHHFCEDQ